MNFNMTVISFRYRATFFIYFFEIFRVVIFFKRFRTKFFINKFLFFFYLNWMYLDGYTGYLNLLICLLFLLLSSVITLKLGQFFYNNFIKPGVPLYVLL